jgi:hypothetical protein
MRSRWLILCFYLNTVLLVVAGGCGGGRELPEGATGTVTGRVTLDGAAVPDGTVVMFQRDEDGQLASGVCDANGEFAVRMKGGLEVVEGTYRVAVMPPSPGAGLSTEEMMKASMDGTLAAKTKAAEVIPVRYRDLQASKTLFQVKPGSNTFELDMKK